MLNNEIKTLNEKRNFLAFAWHSLWLAFAQTFADRNTVLPGLILLVGGTKFQLGILTTILIGVPVFSQLLFAAFLSKKPKKKNYLLAGIYLRVLALGGVALTLSYFKAMSPSTVILMVYLWMIIFTLSGAFAGVSYTDMLGKSIKGELRKKFFVVRQLLSSTGILISALVVRQVLKLYQYPKNYEVAFLLAFGLLIIASFGFIAVKESSTEVINPQLTFFKLLHSIPSVLRKDKNLKYFIIISNLAGFSLTIIPFYIALAKDQFHLNEKLVGNFLLFQIIGMILSNFLWNYIVKKYSFKGVLKSAIILEGMLPIIAIALAYFSTLEYFVILFFISGSALSAHKISFGGMLIEISKDENRALYAGVFGALSLTITIFPLLIGLLINWVSYIPIFIVISIIISSSFFLTKRIECNNNASSE